MQVNTKVPVNCLHFVVIPARVISTLPLLQVSGWDLHCARLAHSLNRMWSACPALQESVKVFATQQLDAAAVASLVTPTVQAAASRLDNTCSLWKVAILLFPRGTGILHIGQQRSP